MRIDEDTAAHVQSVQTNRVRTTCKRERNRTVPIVAAVVVVATRPQGREIVTPSQLSKAEKQEFAPVHTTHRIVTRPRNTIVPAKHIAWNDNARILLM
jgi:hypothetical protein